jgi:NitT/TauT family transport system substrate-binding protein
VAAPALRQPMTLRIMASRHSAFYSPLIATIAGGFLDKHGLTAEYSVLGKGQRSSALIREGVVDVMQSAVSSNWKPLENGESPLPVHFATINQRDGFFLVARESAPTFNWEKLEGKAVLADHGLQPIVMLQYAARLNHADWRRINAIDAGAPEEMEQAFRQGLGDFVHLQSPAAHHLEADGVGHVVASVGESMPPVAFSSLCCSRSFLETETRRLFLAAFREAREWVQRVPAEESGAMLAPFFDGIPARVLASAIHRYQALGCWEGDIEISRDLYEQALNVFESEGEISRRHGYEDVIQRGKMSLNKG